MGLVAKEMNWASLFLQPNTKINKRHSSRPRLSLISKDAKKFKAVAKLELTLAFFFSLFKDEIIFQTNEVYFKMITFYYQVKFQLIFGIRGD